MNARQHIYVKIMQFAAVLCECVRVAQGRGGGGLEKMVGNRLNLAADSSNISKLQRHYQRGEPFFLHFQLNPTRTRSGIRNEVICPAAM